MEPVELSGVARVRLLELRDALDLYRLVDAERDRLRPWMPWADATRSAHDVSAFIYASRGICARGPMGVELGIWVEDRLEGVVGLNRFDWTHRTANLGFWISARHEGRGLVTTVSTHLVAHGFDGLKLARIEARADVDNLRSRRTVERLGFRPEGIARSAEVAPDGSPGRRDIAQYGLLSSDPRPQLAPLNSATTA